MYLIEGNIGAGKSTFARILQQRKNFSVVFEPVNRWNSTTGSSLLQHFYTNPTRWAYTLEMYAMLCRFHDYLQYAQQDNLFMERSFFSGYACFAKNSFMQGFMSELEWQLYQQWFSAMFDSLPPITKAPQGFIYLRCTPEIAYNRIIKRNRNAEKTISLEYLKAIHKQHEEFLMEKNNPFDKSLNIVPILILDADVNFESDEVLQKACIQKVDDFIGAKKLGVHEEIYYSKLEDVSQSKPRSNLYT